MACLEEIRYEISGDEDDPILVPKLVGWTIIDFWLESLLEEYRHTLENLSNEKGLLGLIFNKSQINFQDPAKRRRLVFGLSFPCTD